MSFFLRGGFVFSTVLSLTVMVLGATEPYPLGVDFGARQITAAYIAADGQQVPVAAVDGGDKYEALVRDSVSNQGRIIRRFAKSYIKDNNGELVPVAEDPEENAAAEQVFENALKKLKTRVNDEEVATKLSVTSVSVPQHFNDTLLTYATRAIRRSEAQIIRPWQVRRSYNAVRMAYHLNNHEGFGIPEYDYDEDDFNHLLHIDLNDHHLELCLADVGRFHFSVEARKTLELLGAKEMEKDDKSYRKPVNEALTEFINAHLEGDGNNHELETLRAIVLSGDAPPDEFATLKNLVALLLPGKNVRDSVEPQYVGAVGAAEWARMQVQDPHILEDIKVSIHDIPSHDEL